jgi:ribosome recycling factor
LKSYNRIMETSEIIKEAEVLMNKAIAHLEIELVKIRAGKASPDMLDGIVVDYYGVPTPVIQAANVNNIDSRTLSISPYEKNMLAPIERAIFQSNIGITPSNDGSIIKLFMPPLSEERRKEFVKKAHAEGEQGKIAVRNIRRDAIEQIKKLQKDGLSEDLAKSAEDNMQDLTNKKIALIDNHCSIKEKELMTL